MNRKALQQLLTTLRPLADLVAHGNDVLQTIEETETAYTRLRQEQEDAYEVRDQLTREIDQLVTVKAMLTSDITALESTHHHIQQTLRGIIHARPGPNDHDELDTEVASVDESMSTRQN